MVRLLLEMARTPYVLWMDAGSWFEAKNWPEVFASAVAGAGPFDLAGRLATWGPKRDLDRRYMSYVRARPW